MRISACFAYSLLFAPFSSAAQVSFNSTPASQATTLIDALSADPDFTSLLKLLQNALLVPTLNRLNGSTLFAPTNDAIKKDSLLQSIVDESNDAPLRDNVQEALRQRLYYHLLDYNFPPLPTEQNPQVHKTLHFPRKPRDPPTNEPPPQPPWLPIPGGTLGGEPQRLRVASVDKKIKVGVDAFGKGGAKVTKGQVDAGNGVLLGIDKMLTPPADLATIVSAHPSLKYFRKIATPGVLDRLNDTAETTIFLPVDNAWADLSDIDRLYLESEFATEDLLRIVDMHAVVANEVYWSDSLQTAINLTTEYETTLEIVHDPESGKTFVSDAELVEPDIYASNGVIHTVTSLLIPPDALKLTPEKYLLTLNCTTFVSLLHSVDLQPLINSTDGEYTILAPRDDVLKVFGDPDGLPEKGSEELKRLLSYHFIPGQWTPEKLKHGMLLETTLQEPGLDGGRQVLEVEVSSDDHKHAKERNIRLGGAGVIGEHVQVNDTLIYLISTPLTPPADVLQTALPTLDYSYFISALASTSLSDRLKTWPRTTFLIPKDSAFQRLGMLVSSYLLLPTSKSDLESVLLHHIINGVEYSQALLDGSQQTYAMLDGSDVRVSRNKSTITVYPSGGWPEMRAELTPHNMLTKTGVIHELSDVVLPRSLNMTVSKLVKAAKGSVMATLITRAGMDWVLNGTAPPEDAEWGDERFKGMGWTLLCPTDAAFSGHNLSRLYDDVDRLKGIVRQHLIPTPKSPSNSFKSSDDPVVINQPIRFDRSESYITLQSNFDSYGEITFRAAGEDDGPVRSKYVVGIKGARGTEGTTDWAHVQAWGRTTSYGGAGGVIQIDQVLSPYQPTFLMKYGNPAVVLVVGIVLIGAFFWGVRAIWRRDTVEATYEPVGGFGNGDDDP